MRVYDFIVIGGGSAGYNAARAAADSGLNVAVVDGARQLGGLCILRGCMPSKTLIYSAEVLHLARQGRLFGLRIPSAKADMKAVHARKRRIIAEFAAYRVRQLQTGKFDLIRSNARFLDPHSLQLANGTKLHGRHFLIATGSKPSVPPIPGLKEAKPWTSDEALELDRIPPSVIVLGGGIVACELAQFMRRVGSRVTLIQRSRAILRDHSGEAARVVVKAFEAEGIEVLTGTELVSVSRLAGSVSVRFRRGGKPFVRKAAELLNALGRDPNTGALGLETTGVETEPDGHIITNKWQQTTLPHIYAAGDCCGPHEIVHLAVQQGVLAARHAARERRLEPVDESLLLNVVFTDPQVATIGLRERGLKESGVRHLSASYPFDDHGKSILMEAKHGFVKVVAEPVHGRILGAEIVGKDAGELIHCFSGPLAMGATVFDLLRAPWYHPTLAEIVTYPLEEIAEKIAAARRRA